MDLRQKRICIICGYYGFYPLGGAEHQTHLMADELQKRGADVCFITTYPMNAVLRENGVTVYAFKKPFARKRLGTTYLPSYGIIWRYLCEAKPHLIIQRSLTSLSAVCHCYSKKYGVPFIYSVSSDHDLFGIRVQDALRHPLSRIDYSIGRWGMMRSTAIVVQSHVQQRYLKDISDRDGVLIRNMYLDHRARNGSREKINQVVCYCKYNRMKSPLPVLKIARKLPHITFVIIGLQKDSWPYKGIHAIHNIPDNVRLAGVLNRTDLLGLLQESKVLLSTSTTEGFPNMFIEAWMNKTVVVSLHVNVDGLFTDHPYGFFAHDDPGLAADIIQRLISDKRESDAVAEESYAFAAQEFGIKRNYEKYEKLFLEAMLPSCE